MKKNLIYIFILAFFTSLFNSCSHSNVATEGCMSGQTINEDTIKQEEKKENDDFSILDPNPNDCLGGSFDEEEALKYAIFRAEEMGVSTKGTAAEIEARIQRKILENQAIEMGLSTEGTDKELKERVFLKTLQDVAQKESLSTEGTIQDVLHRIHNHHKEIADKYGVSPDGSLDDIYNRIRIQQQILRKRQKESWLDKR